MVTDSTPASHILWPLALALWGIGWNAGWPALAAFLFGVSRLFSNIMIGIPTIVAAVCLIKADSILQTFGMVI